MELTRFQEIWVVDFEFQQRAGECPLPICLVAREFHTGRRFRLWADELQGRAVAPYPTGPDCLFVAYFASAEMGCHLALHWPLPARILDLYVEFRGRTNGLPLPCGAGLLGALAWFGLDGIGATEKSDMRDLAIQEGHAAAQWGPERRAAMLDYCESDVTATTRLLRAMIPKLDLPRALLRGRYMAAVACMERTGVPLDGPALATLRANWQGIKAGLVSKVDARYGIFEDLTFKADKFAVYLAGAGIPWPRLESGALDLKGDTFKDMARAYPQLQPLRELRATLSELRLEELAVGKDGRNRAMLSPFRSKTGRNQPSNTRFVFGPATWIRGLIKPGPGRGLAYIDWSQQEFGIAAALSGDSAMQAAYGSGDPYLEFAKQAGAVPLDATKKSHAREREQFKAAVLAVQYSMGPDSLAVRIGQPVARARELLELHRRTYRTYWAWNDRALDQAMLGGRLWTVYGWQVQPGGTPNSRSLRNFPMQANGAELLRLACSLATERGVGVCAPVHDAVLIEAPLTELDATVAATQAAMLDASRAVLSGFELGSDAKVIRAPARYMDERGAETWGAIWRLLGRGPDSPLRSSGTGVSDSVGPECNAVDTPMR